MDFHDVVHSIQTLNTEDALRPRLSSDQWRILWAYLTRHEIRAGDLLIRQGEQDRALYILEKGSLQVFVTGGAAGGSKIAILRPGSVVGEPSLFGDGPRSANVEAMMASTVWALRGTRFEELVNRSPLLAFELLRACGQVMATRMRANMARQIPFC